MRNMPVYVKKGDNLQINKVVYTTELRKVVSRQKYRQPSWIGTAWGNQDSRLEPAETQKQMDTETKAVHTAPLP